MRNIIILCLVLLFSCVSRETRKHRRALRLIEKARSVSPDAFKIETITLYDTVWIEKYRIDTISQIITHDTVTVINNERVLLKYFYDTTRMEIYHEIECKGDTVYREVTIEVERLVPLTIMQQYGVSIFWFALFLLVAIVCILIWKPPKK